MRNKDIKGIPVISIADAERFGKVTRVYLDAVEKTVVGFVVDDGNGLMAPDQAVIVDADNVRSLGPDALMIDGEPSLSGPTTEARFDDLVDLDSLEHHRVVTAGGTQVGQIASIAFDEHHFGLTEIEVSPGFFKSNKIVPIDQVVSIGSELIVVEDAVLADPNATPHEDAEEEPEDLAPLPAEDFDSSPETARS